ncbi:MAG: sulfatase [Gemmatimonadaceae bacterium]|nr:sulfatase [Gemmatimonadaceae bacterium]
MNSVEPVRRAAAIPSPASLVPLILASALAAGIGELVLRLLATRFLPAPVAINPASIWLGPVSAAIIFTPLIVAVWLGARLIGSGAAWSSAVAVAAFLATFDVLLLVPRLHPAALAVLALGVAAQVTLVARRHPAPFRRVLTGTAALLSAVAVAGGMLTARTGGISESLSGAGVSDDAPNVLFLVLDTVRALELSAYGYERNTSPRLAQLAAEGVRFDRAVSPAPWTLPSHATMFTGRFQRDLSVGWSTALDTVPPTVAEHFSSLGYATGGFVANLRYCGREYGLGRGFQTYRDFAMVQSQIVGSTMAGRRLLGLYNDLAGKYVLAGRKDAARVVDEFLDWQEERGSRPYFAFLNFFDAHEPYAPDAPYDLAFLSSEPPTRALMVGESHDPAEVEGLRGAYDGAIASLDAQLGRLFDELARRGSLDRTIVVVTSDHGEEFAEHGYMSHGNGLNFPALHVPLLIRWPKGGVPAGAVVETPVSLADLAATLIDLTASAERSVLPGASLAPLWRGEAVPNLSPVLSELYWVRNQPDFYPVSRGNMRSLVRGRFHYIAGPEQREELYDIVADPFERIDLLADPAVADTLSALRRAMAAFPAEDRQGR